jgi:hypothetical protein
MVPLNQAGFVLDSLTLAPGSIQLTDTSLSYTYNPSTGLILVEGSSSTDSVQVCYRRLSFSLQQAVSHHTLQEYDSTAPYRGGQTVNQDFFTEEESFFKTPEIQKSGSISRGISFGNNQDVVVQSSLNLELDGKISDEIGIRASISDQDVPFQPEGNTQNLQEFDRVYVELFTDSSQLMAGDLMLKAQPNPFLRFQRSVQGLAFAHRFKRGELEIGAAAAKGQYIVAELDPVEGLLGPYRLPGTSSLGDQFSAVLANSEKVFLDGRLLIRGFNQDYVIDYNLGEITFTPGTIITQYSQIRVEYEYINQAYRRGITTASYAHRQGRVRFQTSFFQEQDNRNRPLFSELSNNDKELLSLAGDNLNDIFSSTIDSVGFQPETIRYAQRVIDSQGVSYTYYEFSTNPEEAVYQLSFADVGLGNGNYILERSTPQGRIYRWVEPVNGIAQGRFAPVRRLESPKRQRSVGLSTQIETGRHSQVFADGAFSDRNLNLYSDLDSEDDGGGAFRLGFQINNKPLRGLDSARLSTGFSLEQLTANYTAVDPFREANFDRYWGLVLTRGSTQQYISYGAADRLLSAWVGLEEDALNRATYTIRQRSLTDSLQGWQHEVTAAKAWGLFRTQATGFLTNSELPEQDVTWRQLRARAKLALAKIQPGYAINLDQNYFRNRSNDSVSFSAQYYTEHQVFVESPDEAAGQYKLQYSYRTDHLPNKGEMQEATRSHTYLTNWQSAAEGNQQYGLTASYRRSQALLDSAQTGDEEILTGQFFWLSNWAKNSIRQEVRYATGSGREYRRDYVYVQVPVGQGTHFWRDDNSDGEQQLDEFYEATFPDERQFIRLLTVGNELAQTFTTELNYRLNINPPAHWRDGGGWLPVLANFNFTGSARLQQKITEGSLLNRYVPVLEEIAQRELLYQRQNWQGALFYNRADPKWGADISLNINNRKQNISAGQELYNTANLVAGLRRSFTRIWNVRLEGIGNQQENRSQYLGERQFIIEALGVRPQLTWLPSRSLQVTLEGRYITKENKLNPQIARSAQVAESGLGITFSQSIKTQLRLQARLSQLDFEGTAASPAGYALLEALQPGRNVLWSANWQQKLMQGLFLQAQYEARDSPTSRTIHTGSMSVRALF